MSFGSGFGSSGGSPGPAGTNGATWLSGSSDPSIGQGVDGDFYFKTSTGTIFGPKTGGAWGSGTTIAGAAGADGKTIRNGSGAPSNGLGNDGDFYINTAASTIYGPKASGLWGSPTSLVGYTSNGSLVASLTNNVSFAATETKTLHTIAPPDNQMATYLVVYRAVPATNNGSGAGVKNELNVMVRKASGVATVVTTTNITNIRSAPLNASTSAVTASGGNILVQFSTSGGAATMTRCDVYADTAT